MKRYCGILVTAVFQWATGIFLKLHNVSTSECAYIIRFHNICIYLDDGGRASFITEQDDRKRQMYITMSHRQ
jgi:hypothetical protein